MQNSNKITLDHSPRLNAIVLAHVACSGGSVIYRSLCQEFGLCGLSEVSHFAKPPDRNFSPRDPEYQLFLNLGSTDDSFESIFDQRLSNCLQITSKIGKRLLVREHTHSLLFQDSIMYPGCSWIAKESQLRKTVGIDFLLTVRDPVDSWLGFQYEFGHAINYDFDEYCRRYNILLDSFEALDIEKKMLVKYEEMIFDYQKTLKKFATTFDLYENNNVTKTVVSSGNSGRQSNVLTARPRRSFSNGLVRKAATSRHYQQLAERLQYPKFYSDLSSYDVLKSHYGSLKKFAMGRIIKTAKAAKTLLRRNATAD